MVERDELKVGLQPKDKTSYVSCLGVEEEVLENHSSTTPCLLQVSFTKSGFLVSKYMMKWQILMSLKRVWVKNIGTHWKKERSLSLKVTVDLTEGKKSMTKTFSSSSSSVGRITQRKKLKVHPTGACWRHTVEQDTIKIWAGAKRRAQPSWLSWWTTCGWTEEPEQPSLTSLLTTQTSTCSVSSGKLLYWSHPHIWTHPSADRGFIRFFQVVGWVPSNWGSNPLLPDQNSQTDSICHCLGLLHPGLWDVVLFVHLLLCCWGNPGAANPQVCLLQKYLEHSRYYYHFGKKHFYWWKSLFRTWHDVKEVKPLSFTAGDSCHCIQHLPNHQSGLFAQQTPGAAGNLCWLWIPGLLANTVQ